MPDFLTVEEAAHLLRLKRSTAYQYAHQGLIPAVRVGHFVLVPKARLLEVAGLQQKEIQPGAGK